MFSLSSLYYIISTQQLSITINNLIILIHISINQTHNITKNNNETKKNVQIKSEEEGKGGKNEKTRSYFRFHKYKTTLQAENKKKLFF